MGEGREGQARLVAPKKPHRLELLALVMVLVVAVARLALVLTRSAQVLQRVRKRLLEQLEAPEVRLQVVALRQLQGPQPPLFSQQVLQLKALLRRRKALQIQPLMEANHDYPKCPHPTQGATHLRQLA